MIRMGGAQERIRTVFHYIYPPSPFTFLQETAIGPPGNTREGKRLLRSVQAQLDPQSENVMIMSILQNELT